MGRLVTLLAAVLLAGAGVALVLARDGGGEAAARTAPTPSAHRFDAGAAMRLVRLQVAAGQRPAGSPQLRRIAERLASFMPPGGHLEPVPGQPGLRNVVATVRGHRPGIVIGAHYDTLVKPKGFLGANNGAAGSALVVELARTLARVHRSAGAPELRFVLFDGEEPPSGLPEDLPNFAEVGLRGSRAYVKANPRRTKQMLLLDYVGNRGLTLPREGTSDAALWARVRAAAARVGVGAVFPDRTGVAITDDHTPFQDAGVPAVDFIDWSYPGHACCDALKNIDPRSLDAVGETVVDLLLH